MRWTILLLLLLAACGNSYRQPETWDDQPVCEQPAVPRGVDDYVRAGIEAERAGRDDGARVEYHAAFRNDRWHDLANTRYQDLMIRNGLDRALWQEYLDLWEAQQGRGDALWFHLRPELLRRQGKTLPARGKPLTEQEREALEQIRDGIGSTQPEEARTRIADELTTRDWPQLHRMAISLWPADQLDQLETRYKARAEDDPSDGNALALHALAVARADSARALRMLRDAYVLGLPGYWLYRTLADICHARGEAMTPTSTAERRQCAGRLRTAPALYEYCATSADDSVAQSLARARLRIDELEKQGLDGQA